MYSERGRYVINIYISREISIEHPSVGAHFARPIMCTCLSRSKKRRQNYVGQTRACSKSVLGGKIRPVTPLLFISTIRARAALAWMEEKCSLRKMRNLKQAELHRLKNRGKKG